MNHSHISLLSSIVAPRSNHLNGQGKSWKKERGFWIVKKRSKQNKTCHTPHTFKDIYTPNTRTNFHTTAHTPRKHNGDDTIWRRERDDEINRGIKKSSSEEVHWQSGRKQKGFKKRLIEGVEACKWLQVSLNYRVWRGEGEKVKEMRRQRSKNNS